MLNTSLEDVVSKRTRKGHSFMGRNVVSENRRIVVQSYHTLDMIYRWRGLNYIEDTSVGLYNVQWRTELLL